MASLWMMEWDGLGPDKYEEIRRRVDWEGQVPAGLLLHVAAFDERGLVVTELWNSPEELQAFMENRFLPVIEAMNLNISPGVELYQTHAVFSTGVRSS